MADLIHEITVNAPAEKVHAAITTQAGLRLWWTDDSVAEPRVGTVAKFGQQGPRNHQPAGGLLH
jgi:uncharacterized protein YndB with AHSA1/START domain